MDKKKLVIFAYDFPPSSGGIARLCYEIALGQKKHFDQVVVLTRQKTGEQQPEKSPNFKCIYLPQNRIKCELQAIKILKAYPKKTTTIVTALWYPEAFLSILSGHKNIYSLAHGAELLPGNSRFRKHFWISIFAKYVLQKVNTVIANSNNTAKIVKSISPKSNAIPLPLGVDTNQFKPLNLVKNSNQFNIVTLSRILQFKGYDQVFDAISRLDESLQKNIVWHIGGTGPYLKAFKEKVKLANAKFIVKFHGFIPDNQLNTFYNTSNLFILFTQNIVSSNNIEGFGLVFLEAQASGVPVIATNTGGIPDAIDHNNGGWLLEQNDINGLSSLIENLIKSPELLNEQTTKARHRTVNFCNWTTYNQKLYNLLK